MTSSLKRKLVAGAVAAVAVAGGGAAIAATQFGSPREESQAIVNDAAQQLGVQPSALSDALKKALKNRVDAAVEAGRVTKEQGDALKARIDSGDVPIFGFGHRGFAHHGPFGDLATAAQYLGLTTAQLDTKLDSGKTLAQVAKEQDKSVDGLIQALTDAAKKKLDAGVAAGRLTKSQEESILSDLKQRITDRVNGKAPQFHDFGRGGHFHGAPGFLPGPPPGAYPAT
jgi:hypothetical protein